MARQYGLVHRAQALEAGISSSGIHRRLGSGTWIRHYRCVYGVAGAPASLEQRGLAACLAVGPEAVVSHLSAGAMWGWCNDRTNIHVTVPGQITARPSCVVVHRTTSLSRADVGRLRRVPVTSPARTLLDLGGLLSEREFAEVLQRAVAEGCVRATRLQQLVAAGPGRGSPGAAALGRLLPFSEQRCHVPTSLEQAVAAVLRDVGPAFVREHPVHVDGHVFYLDFAFPHLRVGVEADGRRWHSDATSFERDRVRQNALVAAEWRVLRVTERQVRADPHGVRDRVRELLVRG